MRKLLYIPLLAALTGCLPYPHTTLRSPQITGRVIDAGTLQPIAGAKIYLVEPPHHATYTDDAGRFVLKEVRNQHWALIPSEGEWPRRKDDVVEISKAGYRGHGLVEATPRDVGDIALEPVNKAH